MRPRNAATFEQAIASQNAVRVTGRAYGELMGAEVAHRMFHGVPGPPEEREALYAAFQQFVIAEIRRKRYLP